MRLADILSGHSARAALASVAIFLFGLSVLGGGLVFHARTVLLDELEGQIAEEIVLFREIYQTDGRAGLIASIAALDRQQKSITHRAATLFDPSGARLAGSVDLAPDYLAVRQLVGQGLRLSGTGDGRPGYYATAVRVDRLTIVVGRSPRLVQATVRALLQWLVASGLLVSAGILGVGFVSSRRALDKLQVMQRTLAEVSAGDHDARLPVSKAGDQIDRVSERMNLHLDQLSRLMQGMQSSAAAIAHDLKTPLSHAFLSLQRARTATEAGGDPSPEIDDAMTELERLNGVFDTVLRLSRIKAGDRDGFAEVDVSALVADLAEMMGPVAEDARQTLNFNAPRPVIITGDAGMIRLLLMNLVSNAIQHCPVGTTISVTAGRDPAGRALLEVRDDGPGIPVADRGRIVEPFARSDSARTTPGSGLGLALVRAIAERHGADLVLDDANPGLTVRIRFPAVF